MKYDRNCEIVEAVRNKLIEFSSCASILPHVPVCPCPHPLLVHSTDRKTLKKCTAEFQLEDVNKGRDQKKCPFQQSFTTKGSGDPPPPQQSRGQLKYQVHISMLRWMPWVLKRILHLKQTEKNKRKTTENYSKPRILPLEP